MKALKPLAELISLKGKRALITGSAVGIGRAMAYRFAEAGADLDLVDMNIKGLELVKKELVPFKSEIDIHKVDLSREEEVDALWEELSGKEPDILVNNAGVYPFKNFLEVDDAFLKKVIDINLRSALLMCQYMIRKRLKKGGVIINIGSIEAIVPIAEDLIPYDISKTGVIALTKALAKQYGRNGFRINVILPGGITTPGTKAVAKEVAWFKTGPLKTGIELAMRLPLRRGGQPDEVARIAVVLASDLSSYVHGALVPVDGGFLSA
ncbi:MAG: 2-deoxy-D-gluconate 3-dehydrogenase [Phycisphaerae bacterium SM1_79]|jgi:NAD(P)-dependent dehydrogenase (short-subunit alcohol dehydrogenase family)|nr:MAG: 2-deoxy-D-gluconate 3-dehydrogenase [Phycisphaerae bacterium SM1_79]